MSDPATPSGCSGSGLDLLTCGSGAAAGGENQTFDTLLAAIAGSFASFGAQVALFLLLRMKLSRIYRPRSYLVPEKERVAPPPPGFYQWLVPLFTTPNLAFIQKCGLDAYFFLRYLRMLLKLFLPIALVVLPILMPINRYSGNGSARGLDLLSISNVAPEHAGHRLWAHLLLAIGVIMWFCYVIYKEMRGYIRVRQAYLTSPQHRIRASATTVLVTGIPRKWLTLEALNGLYDVFPGGIKNIWINRNLDELADKVQRRDKIAQQLELAQTNLIKTCRKKHEKSEQEKSKEAGMKKSSKLELRKRRTDEDTAAEQLAQGDGVSAGDQHNTPHGLQDVLHQAEEQEERRHEHEEKLHGHDHPLAFVSQGLNRVGLGAVNQGIGAVGQGLGMVGRGVGAFGQKVVGDVDAGFHRAGDEFNHAADAANVGAGFADDDAIYRQSAFSSDGAPTPPPRTPAKEQDARPGAAKDSRPGTAQPEGPLDSPGRKPHPFSASPTAYNDRPNGSPSSDRTLGGPDINVTRPSVESKPKSSMQIELPRDHQSPNNLWRFWRNNDRGLDMPSPQPHTAEEDSFPLQAHAVAATGGPDVQHNPNQAMSGSKWSRKLAFWKNSDTEEEPKEQYPDAINKECDEDLDGEPRWRRFIEPKDRETMRLPLVNQSWFPAIPFVGKKVDTIYHLRRELARLNLEIETDQNDVEKFPFMNSAFIQFHHQVAAHMACQALSHHVPQHMAPRLVEIAPDDVIWDNMSIKWWERYVRTAIVLIVCAGMIIFYAIPVTFTSLLSKVSLLAVTYRWLAWLARLPPAAISIIQGLLPPILISIILALVPVLFRLLVKQQGVPTGTNKELGVQVWYFAFLFIQVFLIVTLTGGLTAFFTSLASNPGQIIKTLATSLPKGADYFFSYLLVQALSNSAGALLQVVSLLSWFLLGPILDSTPRAKWARQTDLSNVQWGSFFPPFTNFAVIGIIYSVIAPFILVFMLIIFSLFWVVYRYNVLYVYQFRNDTGGLLFPTALNQLFTGVYVLEICLVGYFFIARGPGGGAVCIPQAVIMLVALVLTIMYQWQLNNSFDPLFRYLPITLEDEAVIRDEEFARAQASKFAPLRAGEADEAHPDDQDIQDMLEDREQAEEDADDAAEEKERREIQEHRRSSHLREQSHPRDPPPLSSTPTKAGSWRQQTSSPTPAWKTDRWRKAAPQAASRLRHLAGGRQSEKPTATDVNPQDTMQDLEAQHAVGDVLFSGFADELEDLTPEERDTLVRYAFQHSALRAKRPVVWIPRDRLGVSDDEIKRAERMSTVEVDEGEKGRVVKKNIWISNEGTALDGKGRVVFRRSPPDFSNVDLIAL